jgi:hypothetical protein
MLTVFFFLVVAILFLCFSEKKYLTSFVLNPIHEQKVAQIQSLVSSVLGQNERDTASQGEFSELTYLMTSTSVGQELINEGFDKKIFPDEWDEVTGSWHAVSSLYQRGKQLLFWITGYSGYVPPSSFRVSEFLQKKVAIERVKNSRLYTVSILHANREFSERLLARIYSIADAMIRRQKVKQTRKTLEHINTRVTEVTNVVNKKSLADLVTLYEQELLLLETDQPFVAQKIGEISSSDSPVFPSPFIVLVVSLSLGFIWGACWVLLKSPSKTQ